MERGKLRWVAHEHEEVVRKSHCAKLSRRGRVAPYPWDIDALQVRRVDQRYERLDYQKIQDRGARVTLQERICELYAAADMPVNLELPFETDVHHVYHGDEIFVQSHCGHHHLQKVPFRREDMRCPDRRIIESHPRDQSHNSV